MSLVDRDVFLVSREGEIEKQIAELRSTNSSTTYSVVSFEISPNGLLLALTVSKYDHSDKLKYSYAVYL